MPQWWGKVFSPAAEAENARTGKAARREAWALPRELWMNRVAAGRRDRAIEAMVRGERVRVAERRWGREKLRI
jgi:hypothetical protein